MAIDFEKIGPIVLIRLNRPEAMNCLNREDIEALANAWIRFRDDDDLLVAVVTGAGERSFSTGADLVDLIPKVTAGEIEIQESNPTFLKGLDIYKPIVAAINGFCLAGGTELIQGTDIRLSVPDATFGLTEVKLGLFPAGGSTVHLTRQIPYCRAMEILLLGGNLTADEALSIGLINRIVPRAELMPTAMEIAERLAQNGPLALRAIKESVLKSRDIPVERAYALETQLARKVFSSRDAVEGPKAFIEKRRPSFKGE